MINDVLKREIVDRIRRASDPRRIILFGSHVGDAAEIDSDIDLMVVKDHVANRRREAGKIYRELLGIGVPVDILVATPETLERYKDCWCMVYHDVVRDGVVIYECQQ